MKFLSRCLFLVAFIVPVANADEQPDWFLDVLKKSEPNELAYFASADSDCLFDDAELNSMVEGVFVRSRIKPTQNWVMEPVYLNVVVTCLSLDSGSVNFHYSIRFARTLPSASILYDRTFGGMGVGKKQFQLDTIKTRVEAAVTTYLKANFDL